MPKILLILFSLMVSALSFADTGEERRFYYNGDREDNQYVLKGEETHTEYRYERVARTCYRRVFAGYRTECHWRSRPYCYRDRFGNRVCRTRRNRVCRDVPYYRTEAYTCYREERVPYEVFDHFVETSFDFAFNPPRGPVNEEFVIRTNGEDYSLKANSSRKYIIFATKEESRNMSEDTMNIDVSYTIRFKNMAQAFAPLQGGIKGETVDGHFLSFTIGDVSDLSNVDLGLYMERKRFFGRDEVLVNRNLAPYEVELESMGNGRTLVTVDLKGLHSEFEEGKKHDYKITLGIRLDEGSIINRSDLPARSVSKEFSSR